MSNYKLNPPLIEQYVCQTNRRRRSREFAWSVFFNLLKALLYLGGLFPLILA